MSLQLTSGQQIFAGRLADLSGLNQDVVIAWVYAEENGSYATERETSSNHDWLNIGYTGAGTFGSQDHIWGSPVTAATATYQWMKGHDVIPNYGTAAAGIQAILASAGKSPAEQIAAIQNSGWAGSGYPDLPQLYTQASGTKLPPASAALPGSAGASTGAASSGGGGWGTGAMDILLFIALCGAAGWLILVGTRRIAGEVTA